MARICAVKARPLSSNPVFYTVFCPVLHLHLPDDTFHSSLTPLIPSGVLVQHYSEGS
jgi:hypothetical protein